MSDRKETPDVLGDILNGPTATPVPASVVASPTPESAAKPKAKARRVASAKGAKPVGTEWTYMEVIFREFRGWRPRFVDGEELDGWKEEPVIVDYLKVLGRDGWEMVGIMENGRNTRAAYFKRPTK